jgi:predicted transcriptional regulator
MLIEITKAIKSLSFRLDPEGYSAIHKLANSVNASPSVLMRLAISNLLQKQNQVKAKSLGELIERNHGN